MMGKTRAGMPTVQFETGRQLVKRFKAVQEAKEEFWDRWVKEIFPSLTLKNIFHVNSCVQRHEY
jgi:hypothetical protein